MNINEKIQLKNFLEFILRNNRVLKSGITVSENCFSITDLSKSLVEQVEINLGVSGKQCFLEISANSDHTESEKPSIFDFKLIRNLIIGLEEVREKKEDAKWN